MELLRGLTGPGRLDTSIEATLLSLLMGFVIGQGIAWVYIWTHSGLSYSRTFTQSLVLLTMVVSLVMYVIGNSIITAFGLIGALAIIRFRNILKDTRDTSFVFFALVLGMAVGSQRYATAILGTIVLGLVSLYLHYTAFGTRGRFDGHLSCRLGPEAGVAERLAETMNVFCRAVREVSMRRGAPGSAVECVYQVRLRDRSRTRELMDAATAVPGVENVSFVLHDELAEI